MTLTLLALIGMEIGADPLYWALLSLSAIMKMIKVIGEIRSLRKENDDG